MTASTVMWIMMKTPEKWMANVINAIDSTPADTDSEQVVSESIKSAKEKKYSKSILMMLKF